MKRIIGLVLLVLAIAGLVNVVPKFLAGDTPKTTGNAAYDRGRKVGQYAAPVVLVLLGLFGLRLLLQSDEDAPAPPPVRRNPLRSSPPPGDASLRGGQDTFASNPGMIRLNTVSWLAANPWLVFVAAGLVLVGLAVLFIKLPVGIVLLLSAGVLLFNGVREAKQKFWMGDVCPGVVLSAQQNLVAVYTDLVAAGNLPCPAIKILRQPLQRIAGEPAYDGMRVAAAALYHGHVRKTAWENFSPEVIHCVVRDPEEIARVMNSIPEADWQALDSGLAQVSVAEPGLYRVAGAGPVAPAVAAARSAGVRAAAKPWFQTVPGIVGLAALGLVVGLVVFMTVAPSIFRWVNHRRATQQRNANFPPPPTPRPPTASRPAAPTQAGPYSVGSDVEADWAGKRSAGKITAINPGGFSVMVQLVDARFPRPILLSTNQIRLR